MLSGDAPGYTVPLLLCLRQADVGNVQVAVWPAELLSDLVEKVRDDPAVEQVTLVNLAMTYRRHKSWRPELVEEIKERLEPGLGKFRFVGPLQVNYFSD